MPQCPLSESVLTPAARSTSSRQPSARRTFRSSTRSDLCAQSHTSSCGASLSRMINVGKQKPAVSGQLGCVILVLGPLWGWPRFSLGWQVAWFLPLPIFLLHTSFPRCWPQEQTLIAFLHANLHDSRYQEWPRRVGDQMGFEAGSFSILLKMKTHH